MRCSEKWTPRCPAKLAAIYYTLDTLLPEAFDYDDHIFAVNTGGGFNLSNLYYHLAVDSGSTKTSPLPSSASLWTRSTPLAFAGVPGELDFINDPITTVINTVAGEELGAVNNHFINNPITTHDLALAISVRWSTSSSISQFRRCKPSRLQSRRARKRHSAHHEPGCRGLRRSRGPRASRGGRRFRGRSHDHDGSRCLPGPRPTGIRASPPHDYRMRSADDETPRSRPSRPRRPSSSSWISDAGEVCRRRQVGLHPEERLSRRRSRLSRPIVDAEGEAAEEEAAPVKTKFKLPTPEKAIADFNDGLASTAKNIANALKPKKEKDTSDESDTKKADASDSKKDKPKGFGGFGHRAHKGRPRLQPLRSNPLAHLTKRGPLHGGAHVLLSVLFCQWQVGSTQFSSSRFCGRRFLRLMPTPPHSEKPRDLDVRGARGARPVDVLVETAHHAVAVDLDVDLGRQQDGLPAHDRVGVDVDFR